MNFWKNKSKNGKIVTGLTAFEKEIIYALRRMTLPEIASLPDVSEGLENKIKMAANNCNNLKDLMNQIKSKRFTRNAYSANFAVCAFEYYAKRYEYGKKNHTIYSCFRL